MTKSASADLITHLGLKSRSLALFVKITRVDGSPATVLGFSNHNEDKTIDADGEGNVTYAANTMMIDHGETPQSEDLSVDNMGLNGILKSGAITEADIRAGRYDSAEIKVFLANVNDTSQILKLMSGQIGTIELKDYRFHAQFLSLTYIYQEQIGRLVQPRCDTELGSTRCGITLSAANGWVKSGTVGSVTSRQQFQVDGISGAEGSGGSPVTIGWAEGGFVTFTSGDNNGVSREVASWEEALSPLTHDVDLFLPAPFDISPGDTVDVTVGCNKILSTCRDRFNNVVNFQGFPYLPGRDEVFRRKSTR